MSANLRSFTTAIYGFEHVLKMSPKKAMRMNSPCPEWKGADVVAHTLAAMTAVHRAAMAGPMPKSLPKVADDPVVQWERLRDRTLTALDQPEVLHSTADTFFGPLRVDTFIGLMGADILVHTWDLARTGRVDDRLDPALCRSTLRLWRSIPAELLRRPGVFAAPIKPHRDADAQTKLLNFLGREC